MDTLCHFYLLATVNRTAVNIHVQIFYEYLFKVLWDMHLEVLFEELPNCFHWKFTILHSYKQYTSIPIFHVLTFVVFSY